MMSLKDQSLWNIIEDKSIREIVAFCNSNQANMDICLSSPEPLKRKVRRMFGRTAVNQRPDLTTGTDWLNYLKYVYIVYRYIYNTDFGVLILFEDYVGDADDIDYDMGEYDLDNVSEINLILEVQSTLLPNNFGDFGKIIVAATRGEEKVQTFFYTENKVIDWIKDKVYSSWRTIVRTDTVEVNYIGIEEADGSANNHMELDTLLRQYFQKIKESVNNVDRPLNRIEITDETNDRYITIYI